MSLYAPTKIHHFCPTWAVKTFVTVEGASDKNFGVKPENLPLKLKISGVVCVFYIFSHSLPFTEIGAPTSLDLHLPDSLGKSF